MTKTVKSLLTVGCVGWVLGVAFRAQAADTMMAASASKEVVWPADKVTYKEVMPGVTKATLWEKPSGAYAALTRIAPNTKNVLHTHSSDIHVVVISGSYNYGTETGVNHLGPGSYLLIPGGRKHTSGAGAEGALFYEESPGKFDMTMAK